VEGCRHKRFYDWKRLSAQNAFMDGQEWIVAQLKTSKEVAQMKKILGIIGSPRKLGNSEIVIKEISANLTEPHELKLIRLTDFNILPCRGCYQCLFGKGDCVLNDDFERVLQAIVDADALIVAAPAYFLGPNSSLKRLLDRGLAFYAHIEKNWDKPAVGVGIAGIEGKEGYTLLGVESFLKLIGAEIKQCIMVYGALPGEIFYNEKNREKAAELAESLFRPVPEKQAPSCPLCGGATFRFLGDNRVRCMLCSNTGTIQLADNAPVFSIEKDDHAMLLSKADAIAHRQWLQGMKKRFLEEKSRLKEITLPYREKGEWITP
jgi:multimeric flavodoxin WrbA